MYKVLQRINHKPKPFEYYTLDKLWNDPHISQKMLKLHLEKQYDFASRNQKFMDKSLRWMISHFSINSRLKLCDFGCGPGLYTNPLSKTGARITGIDFSKRSIEHATQVADKQNLSVEYHYENFLEFSTDQKFDLITMIYCGYCALNNQQRQVLLNKFYNLLSSKGKIFLDVYTWNYFNNTEEKCYYKYSKGNGFWAADPYYVFFNRFKYNAEKITLDKFTIFEQNRSREIYNWLQCFSQDSLIQEFHNHGFTITEKYSNVAGKSLKADSKELAVVAVKR